MNPNEMVIHPDFLSHSLFIESIPYRFEQLGITLHNDRNEVKKIRNEGIDFVIKYYKRLTWANRLIYRFFRKSKARRAYENALYLQSKGISTPTPVAYINCYKGPFLMQSYFISVYVEALSLAEILDKAVFYKQALIKDFAKFTYRLHQKGVFHGDYHLKNILYKSESENQFYLIDINRMRFKKTSPRKAVKNMARLHLSFDEQCLFSQEYALQSDINPHNIFSCMFFYRERKSKLNTAKRKLKNLNKSLCSHFN